MSEALESNYEGVFDGRIGFGARPAVIVIDFLCGYTDSASPLFADGVVDAVEATPELLDAARDKGVPVLHTNVRYTPPDFADGGIWITKTPVLKNLVEGNPLAEFDPRVTPLPGETVITKNYASAFFGTTLAPTLTGLGVDTLIIAGCSTSGCVRATAVDTVQHSFRPIVVRDCVGDRHEGPHEANLFDINAKYGDVVLKADVLGYLARL